MDAGGAFGNLIRPHRGRLIWPHLRHSGCLLPSLLITQRLSRDGVAEEGMAFESLPLLQLCRSYAADPCGAFFLCRTSSVRRKRYDSVPVSMMCARSVMRSSKAL